VNNPNQKDYLEKPPSMYQETSPVTESRENRVSHPGIKSWSYLLLRGNKLVKMSGEVENSHHPHRTNKPRDRVGITEWLVVNQRTTAGAVVVSTQEPAARPPPRTPRSECTWSPASVLKYYVSRAPAVTVSQAPSGRRQGRGGDHRGGGGGARESPSYTKGRVMGRFSRRNFPNIIS